jgi:hypothetical protein
VKTIKIAENIKEAIARKLVEQESAGYSKDAQGQWYVVNGSRAVHAERNRPWNPWSDDAVVVSVDELVFEFGGASADHASFWSEGDDDSQFESRVEFALDYVPDSYDADATQKARYAE